MSGVVIVHVRDDEESLEELILKIKIKRYVEKGVKLLEDATPSEKGFAVRSVNEDRENH
uniref:VapB-type antitoxin n=1 Tax=Ignisphaera aggregans TaxID=334771 RepID=A0A7C4D065_9CREN